MKLSFCRDHSKWRYYQNQTEEYIQTIELQYLVNNLLFPLAWHIECVCPLLVLSPVVLRDLQGNDLTTLPLDLFDGFAALANL